MVFHNLALSCLSLGYIWYVWSWIGNLLRMINLISPSLVFPVIWISDPTLRHGGVRACLHRMAAASWAKWAHQIRSHQQSARSEGGRSQVLATHFYPQGVPKCRRYLWVDLWVKGNINWLLFKIQSLLSQINCLVLKLSDFPSTNNSSWANWKHETINMWERIDFCPRHHSLFLKMYKLHSDHKVDLKTACSWRSIGDAGRYERLTTLLES